MARKARRFLPSAFCPAVAVLLALAAPDGAAAATFTVANLADSGPGSLRQAVLDANAAPGDDEVAFAPGLAGTITLTSGEIAIADSLTVAGPGAGVLTVATASPRTRIFRVESEAAMPIEATLSGLTLTDGFGFGEGGAVVAYDENLTILDSVISDSWSGHTGSPSGFGCGGNVALIGQIFGSPIKTLRIVNSTLTGGTSVDWGGNVCVSHGRLILERSTVSGGSATSGGGLVLDHLVDGSAILSSTVFGNEAYSEGGGIFVGSPAGNLLIESSTISGNSTDGQSGGIHLFNSSSSLLLRLTTVSNNTAGSQGGSIFTDDFSHPQVQLDHSIVANGIPQDLAGPGFFLANYSLIESPGSAALSGANNLIGIDPLLGPLTSNGGPTLTHSPLAGSPVINTGDPAIPDPPPMDQRGFARIVGPATDRGSVEAQQQFAIAEVPTLSQWAMLFLSALLFAAGVRRLRRMETALLLALIFAKGAAAATFTVHNLADSGPGSLRQAILDANAAPGDDEVAFAPGLAGTITLTSGEIAITDSLTVAGPGAGVLTVDADYDSRIFLVESPAAAPIDVTLSALTVTRGFGYVQAGAIFADQENLTILDSVISDSSSGVNGTPPSPGCGGNVGSYAGHLRIVNSTLTGGTAHGFGGPAGGNLCATFGTLILERSIVSGGSSESGGGIYLIALTGASRIFSSTVSGNQADVNGGGILAAALRADLTIESSTISGNTAEMGGGMSIVVSDVQVVNSTISGNFANGKGGGIHFIGEDTNPLYGPLLLRLTTVSNNSAGVEGGSILVYDARSEVQLDHSIVANGAPQDLAGEFPPVALTANYSLIEAPGEVLVSGANNLIGIDPLLGQLTSNGGPTLTHSPLPGSPVINTGDPAIPDPPPGDQRGFARIVGPATDRGSVEAQQQIALAEVPTLSQWAMLFLSALLFAAGVRKLRRTGSLFS